jgi:hypothetical protein
MDDPAVHPTTDAISYLDRLYPGQATVALTSWEQTKISVYSCPFVVSLLTPMKESDNEDQHAPLSYHGASRILWLVFLLIVFWLIVRALEPVILLFALVFLLAMVLNPIVTWLQKHHVPRFAGVILLILGLVAITATIVIFAIPPLARQTQELVRNAPAVWQGIATRIESLTQNYPAVREALPRVDEIAGKVGAAAGTVGNILL